MRIKDLVLFAIFLALISPKLSWTTDHDKESLNNKMPLQISEFYDDYNFVSSFSTKSERGQLIKCFSRQELPDELRSKRMEKVFNLMKKLNRRIMSLDSKMVILVRPRRYSFFRSELVEIRDVKVSKKETSVKVYVYRLDPETNLRFISLYEESGGDEREIPPDEMRIQMASPKLAPRIEIHKWILTGERWMKEDVNLIFLIH